MSGRRTWTDDDLTRAVRRARSLHGTFVHLGLAVGGSQWGAVRRRILELGLRTDHWLQPLAEQVDAPTFADVLTRIDLRAAINPGDSRADLIRRLGFEPSRTRYRQLARALQDQHVPDVVFGAPYEAMRRSWRPRPRRPLTEILVESSTYTDTTALKARLIAAGLLEDRCAACHLHDWQGAPITLHLDHRNGVRDDHRIENLRLLCPNCHSQTDTYAGRNKGRRRPSGSAVGEGPLR